MTQFNNIRLPSDTILDPLLVPLVDKLALDKPKWTFKGVHTAFDCFKCSKIIEYKLKEDKVMILCEEPC